MAVQARASHILVKTEDEANKIMKTIHDGEDFDCRSQRGSPPAPREKTVGILDGLAKDRWYRSLKKLHSRTIQERL